MTSFNSNLIDLFSAPASKWVALEDAVRMLTDETVTLAAPVLEGDALSRYEGLSAAADGMAARLDRWTLNAALACVLCNLATDANKEAPSRDALVSALERVPAFVARNTPAGKDAVPQATYNRAIAGAMLAQHGTNKERKAWGENQELHALGGVTHWKSQKLDKAGLRAAITSAETKSAGRTVAKQNQQGKADSQVKPADMGKENKALADAAKNALKSAANAQAQLAAFAQDVRDTASNTSLNADQLRAALRDMCDAVAGDAQG